jgi:hypothetical protein
MKSVGLDSKELSKKREVLTVRLRKQKRYTNLLTKRLSSKTNGEDEFDIDESECDVISDTMHEEMPSSSVQTPPRRGLTPQQLNHIQRYKEVLVNSAPYELRLEAIIYFRKLVASDKVPPIAAIVDQGLLELLLPFFLNFNEPEVQFEIAWIVTNVACDYSHSLVKFNANGGYIPVLMNVLLTATCEKVRDQVYWAIANMSAESDSCRDFFLANNLSESMSWLLNMGSYNGQVRTITPTLATMKYSALICFNLVKDNTFIDSGLARLIVNILAILAQSPDYQDYLHIVCLAIQSLCEISADGIRMLFEKGLPKTLRDIYDSKKIKENSTRDLLVHTLATFIVHCNNRLYLRVLLSDKFNNLVTIFTRELNGMNIPNSGSVIIESTAICIIKAFNRLSIVDSKYTTRLIKEGVILALMSVIYNKDDYELRRYAGEYLSTIILSLIPNGNFLKLFLLKYSHFYRFYIDIRALTAAPNIAQIYELLVSYDSYDESVLFSILSALKYMVTHSDNKNIFQLLYIKLDVYLNHNNIAISTIANDIQDSMHT